MDHGIAVTRHPRIAIEPVNAASQEIEPDLIAGCAAEGAGDEHTLPRELARRGRDAHRDVVDLAFDDGEEKDGDVEQHEFGQLVIWSLRHSLNQSLPK